MTLDFGYNVHSFLHIQHIQAFPSKHFTLMIGFLAITCVEQPSNFVFGYSVIIVVKSNLYVMELMSFQQQVPNVLSSIVVDVMGERSHPTLGKPCTQIFFLLLQFAQFDAISITVGKHYHACVCCYVQNTLNDKTSKMMIFHASHTHTHIHASASTTTNSAMPTVSFILMLYTS